MYCICSPFYKYFLYFYDWGGTQWGIFFVVNNTLYNLYTFLGEKYSFHIFKSLLLNHKRCMRIYLNNYIMCLPYRSWFRMRRMLGPLRSSSCMMRWSMEWNHCGHLIWLSIKVMWKCRSIATCPFTCSILFLAICNKQNEWLKQVINLEIYWRFFLQEQHCMCIMMLSLPVKTGMVFRRLHGVEKERTLLKWEDLVLDLTLSTT